MATSRPGERQQAGRVGTAMRAALSAEIRQWRQRSGVSLKQIREVLDRHVDGPSGGLSDQAWNNRINSGDVPATMWPALAQLLNMQDEGSRLLVESLGYDPTYLLRKLEVLPVSGGALDETIDQIYRLHRLELEINALQMDAAVAARGSAVASIVAAATGQQYAAAVWPAYEGPSHADGRYLMHTADRIDLRRVDGTSAGHNEVWANHVMRSTLSAAFAVRGNVHPRWSTPEDTTVSRWAVKYLGAPMSPRISRPHAGFPCLAISSVTSGAGGSNLAGVVALALGYGVTSTSDLAAHLHDRQAPATTSELRNVVHDRLLGQPRDRRVWHHSALLNPSNAYSPWAQPSGVAESQLVHVRLVESDELLHEAADGRSAPLLGPSGPLVKGWQQARDLAMARHKDLDDVLRKRILILNVEHVDANDRALLWTRTMEQALQVLNFMHDLGFRPQPSLGQVQVSTMLNESGYAPAVFRWLKDHGAPFVDAP